MIVRTRKLRRLVRKYLKNESAPQQIDRAFDFRRFTRALSGGLDRFNSIEKTLGIRDSMPLRTQAQNPSSLRTFSTWLSVLIWEEERNLMQYVCAIDDPNSVAILGYTHRFWRKIEFYIQTS